MENDMMTVLLVQPGKHPVEITIPHTLNCLLYTSDAADE